MTTNYKILGQELNNFEYICDENTNTIFSKLKIKNTSFPSNIDINIGPSTSFNRLDDLSITLTGDDSLGLNFIYKI